MKRDEILQWLRESQEHRLAELWRRADAARRQNVGDAVHLRGLIEISNHCVRQCRYCGLRAGHTQLRRYRLTADEILACARQAVALGYGTAVLQAGEDPGLTAEWLADVVRRIKAETLLAVTLSLGERRDDELAQWRHAGADRYLLRFETSNRALYDRLHPPLVGSQAPNCVWHGLPSSRAEAQNGTSTAWGQAVPPGARVVILRRLRELGYEVGSGVMIGLPGQSFDNLANDLELFRELDLDMIGVGPYIAHPATPLAGEAAAGGAAVSAEQAPATELLTYKMIALARLVCPRANIPSTTALATLNLAAGRELGLARGANVIMPNLTPLPYRALYEIYPAKACLRETADQCGACLRSRLLALGRPVGTGHGDAPRRQAGSPRTQSC
jgi:biotin synthase